MKRIPAACAMEWSIELEKALRSKKSGRSIEAIQQVGRRLCLWSGEPELTKAVYDIFGLSPGEDRLFANTILLRLVDAFRMGDRDTRLSVARVFLMELKNRKKMKCKHNKGILSKARVSNHLELLKRVKIVFDTGDAESRGLALVLFGCWADFAKDNAHIRYLILSSLVSTNMSEVKCSLFAAGCFCELANDFAIVVLEMLVGMITSSETLSIIRLAGVRVFAKMGCSYFIANRAYKIGLKLVLDSKEEDFSVAMLVSLSKLAFKSALLQPEQVDLLLSFLSREQSLRLRTIALRCLRFMFGGGACHSSVCINVVKTLLTTLDETQLPSAMQCDALQILHEIFLCRSPNLAQDNVLEFTHLLSIVENSTLSSTVLNSFLALRVLVEVAMLLSRRIGVQPSEDSGSPLLVQIISVITNQIILLIKPFLDHHQPNARVLQNIEDLLNLLVFMVREHPDLGDLVLDKIRLFIEHLINICNSNTGTRQASVSVDKTIDIGEEKNTDNRLKLLHIVHKFHVTCILKLNEVGAITPQVLDKVKCLVDCVHRCSAFDCYMGVIYSMLLYSGIMWDCIVNKDKDDLCSSLCNDLVECEILTLESVNKMLKEGDNWLAYKAGTFAACQGAWVTAAFIFKQLTSKTISESCSCWLKLLAQFSQSESKIQLFLLPQLRSGLADWSKMKHFPMFFVENFGEIDQRSLPGQPNYSEILVRVYYSASRETFESIMPLNKSFCFQRWFLALRAKVLGTLVDVLNVMGTISVNQDRISNNGEVKKNVTVECLNALQQITEIAFQLKRLAQEYDLLATSFIGMDSKSSEIISALALGCSLLAFTSGFALLVLNLPAFETLTHCGLERSNNSLRGQLIQNLVGRLWLIDQETCSNLCVLLGVSEQPEDCFHLQTRRQILNIGGEVREILNICHHVVSGMVGLQNEVNRVHNEEILCQVTKDGLLLLFNTITKYLHIPFHVPKYFFKVRPCIGAELFVSSADTRNPIELHVLPGFCLSLNLCFQLRNLPPDLSFPIRKSYCILYSSTSFEEKVSNGSTQEKMQINYGSTQEQIDIDSDFLETDSMIQLNERLLRHLTESTAKTYNGKCGREKDSDHGDDGIVHSFLSFELNDIGQGFSNRLIDVSGFPVGSYRIKWHSCCIDSRGSYWSLLPLNVGPVFTVQTT